jgi:hypothetical protein
VLIVGAPQTRRVSGATSFSTVVLQIAVRAATSLGARTSRGKGRAGKGRLGGHG